ncbi:IS630 transposase-related protein [Synechococcus elongatus]|uniref:Transposase Synechocystis PCC 6803 domain-containing protein n=2 Tax=Synechococcus elongatus TaxID=32046 RepID=Q31NM8_SYNE7|nr:IS630 transposase-related protein [Synechococcus elongatus]ABB57341.1 conserved hypothetical protein [Synechococcus elongatus PCC 7942 = FACHB-805]AJD58148.1 transposase [Synechococcus elongatus UTEX 2973]MBD2587748.1 helix-turn-helix domain-containing protein [Synechococcus elongatus FACHB-242]MBD2688473.1 helix-turn-helix domain-containing protein [Synechococcus elongatus FACHB-1061]MBD2707544.1 helix-turn-helix domain-containing protein [Synechococcus elongatus PCC 7942 = FACHB-805]
MPAAYSNDLREKALAAVAAGERKSHVSQIFNISRNTLDLWIKRKAETGSVSPRRSRPGPAGKIRDLEAFRTFVEQHGHLTQEQMAALWPEPISSQTLGRALKRIGFTRKKELRLPRTR